VPVTTVLFDLGGVVCHFDPAPRLAALAAASGRTAAEVHERLWDSGFSSECDRGAYTAQEMYSRVRDLLGMRMTYIQFRSVWALAFEVNTEILSLIDTLQASVRTALLTDNPPVLQEALPLRFPEIASRLDPLLFSCELKARKPSGRCFARALRRLDERPENVILVDDSPKVVEGAREVGLAAVLYYNVDSLRRELADHILVG